MTDGQWDNVIRGIWDDELERSKRILESKKNRLAELPKGSIHGKKINGGVYYYLCYREKDKIKSEYLGSDPQKVGDLRERIKNRKALELSIRRSMEDIRLLEKAVKLK